MATLPNFVIAGAPKAGTTSLYYYLQQHPDITFPKLKEPKYFSSIHRTFPQRGVGDASIDGFAVKELSEYQALYEGMEDIAVRGDASPDYLLYAQETAPSIREVLGDVPILISLRDPVKRAFSSYSNLVRDNRERLTFREGLEKEAERLADNWDFMWAYKKGGEYSWQIQPFLDHFSNVKVVLQDDLAADDHGLLKDICEFLGVDASFAFDTSMQHNPSGKPNNFIARFILNRDSKVGTAVREVLKAVMPRSVLEKVASKSLDKLQLDPADDAYLRAQYTEEIEKLEALIRRDLSAWKPRKNG